MSAAHRTVCVLFARLVSVRRRCHASAGFVLVPVLWTLALLSLVAMTLAKTTIVDIRTNAYLVRQAEAEALADGLARLTVRNLLANRTAGRRTGALAVDGRGLACRLANSIATIAVQDTAGQIDLNQAPPDLLEQLLAELGVPKDTAARLVAAIIDFRDADDIPLPGGAESAEYRSAGRPYGPKNAPFASVGELDQVLGMTPAVLAAVRPFVTVHSRSRGLDLAVAHTRLRGLAVPAGFAATSSANAFLVRIGVHHVGGAQFVRELVFEPSVRAPSGFIIAEWGRGAFDPNLSPVGQAGDLPPCLEVVLGAE